MSDRTSYFLDPAGQRVTRLPSEHDHADIGRRVLASHSITPTDYNDTYHQMHRLGYVRVVDYHDIAQIHAENDSRKFTQAQMDFLRAHALELKYRLVLNNRKFVETREGGAASHPQLVAEALADRLLL